MDEENGKNKNGEEEQHDKRTGRIRSRRRTGAMRMIIISRTSSRMNMIRIMGVR